MNIEQISNLRFGEEFFGIILDDAYDVMKKNKYIDFVKKNQVKYISSRDVDMRNLLDFCHIEYLTVPEDAEHLESLSYLTELKGLEITAKCLSQINLKWFSRLDSLVVHGQPKETIDFTSLKRLYCLQWKIRDLSYFCGCQRLKFLTLDFCSKLETLQGAENFSGLEEISLDYCLHLNHIESLEALSDSLKMLVITDCNRIKDFQCIEKLKKLETFHLTMFQTSGTGKLASVKFIDSHYLLCKSL